MKTNVDVDERLIREALQLSRLKSKRELIHLALKEFVESRRRLNLLDLEGKFEFTDSYDYKALRERS